MTTDRAPEVVVVGGGVAALEFVLALQALMGDRVRTTVVAPNEDFVLRPRLVAAPLETGVPWHWPLAEIADRIGFGLVRAEVTSVDPADHRIVVRGGDALPYDSLVLALGARTLPVYDDALELGDADGARALQTLREQIRQGAVRRVAFVVPARAGWLPPVYEAALLMANSSANARCSLLTPEARPLEQFGVPASTVVSAALEAAGVEFAGGGRPFDPADFDRIVTVPLLRGPRLAGVPSGGLYGLIEVDDHARVRGLRDVYAAGDATDYPIKLAGLACLQADCAAETVAAAHGHDVRPRPFRPKLRATLETGAGPPLLLNGGQGLQKLPGRHLAGLVFHLTKETS
jgi:sulfide:quinone oxidoreductase